MTLRASANASLTNFDEAYENVLAAWQAASAPGEILPPVDTDFFPVTTLVTAKLFSTRDDYKGGEWRKRCQDKSWYNETIYGNQIGVGYYANEAAARAVSGAMTNDYYYDTTANLFKALNAGSGTTTIYRGGRREFPENQATTYEATRAVIWDLDFGAPRMWKVETYTGKTIRDGTWKNGKHVVATSTGVFVRDYVQDRFPTAESYTTSTTQALVNASCNAVAITNLPNSPLDEYGMPKPTIAVGTDGGVTVLGWDGVADNVAWDIVVTSYTYVSQVGFGADGRVSFTAHNASGGAFWLFSGPIPTADVSFAYTLIPSGYSSIYSSGDADQNLGLFPAGLSASGIKVNPIAGNYKLRPLNSTGPGLEIYRENPTAPTKGMGAKITHTYNSGTLVGNIKRAWLADTTAETLTAATPLSATFDSDVDGFAANSSAVVTWDAGGKLSLTRVVDGNDVAYKTVTCVIGKTYNCSASVDSGTGTAQILVGTTATNGTAYSQSVAGSAETWTFSFVATATTHYICASISNAATRLFDNITVKLAEPDRCIKNKALTVVGSLTKSAVASGANLVVYSGFGASNYLEEAYSSDLDFGTGDFCVMGWVNVSTVASYSTLIARGRASVTAGDWALNVLATSGYLSLTYQNVASVPSTLAIPVNTPSLVGYYRTGGKGYFTVNGVIQNVDTSASQSVTDTSATVVLGSAQYTANPTYGSLALWRISATAPTAEQIPEIYEQEKKLFKPNAQCTLAGSSSAVLAVDHDDVTGVTSVLTSYGRSDFKGLVRVASEATAVGTPKAVSALGGSILQVGSTGIDYYAPAKNLREELPTDLGDKPRQLFDFDLSSATTCTLPQGWKPTGSVWQAGGKLRQGASEEFTVTYDGFLWSVVLGSAATAWVQVEGEMQ